MRIAARSFGFLAILSAVAAALVLSGTQAGAAGGVSIASSLAGRSTVTGVVTWTASVAGRAAVARVEFLVDGKVRSADGTPPFVYGANGAFDTRALTNGLHAFGVRAVGARDATLAATSSNVTVANNAPAAQPASASTATTVSAPLPSASPSGGAGARYGVHQDLTWESSAVVRQAAISKAAGTLHAQISRNSFLWHLIEPTQGVRDWSRTDAVVDELTKAGIEPLFVMYGSPSWANGVSQTTPDWYLYVPPPGARFDQWLAQYADFAEAAARRYQGSVRKWEIWNEENEHYFWKPAPNVDQYIRLYTTLRAAILRGNPSAQVAVGGLAGPVVPGYPPDVSGRNYLQHLIDAKAPLDYVAIHPYMSKQQAPDVHIEYQGNFDDIGTIRKFLDEHKQNRTELWVTEWGWKSDVVGLAKQAEYVAKSLSMLRNQFSYVKVATIFIDFDRPEYSQGLFYADLTPKPAAGAFAAFMTGSSASSPPAAPAASTPPAAVAATPAPAPIAAIPVVATQTSRAPAITGFTPTRGRPGTTVQITGVNLDGTNSVRIKGAPAFVRSVSARAVAVVVPSVLPGPGKVELATAAGSTSSGSLFLVLR